MSDLICRKTMMRCQTPGMCSPFGGCQPSVLKECDVRYGDSSAEHKPGDWSELKQKAQAAADEFGSYDPAEAEIELMSAISPGVVLALIAENEQLLEKVENFKSQFSELHIARNLLSSLAQAGFPLGEGLSESILAVRHERDQLRAEVEALRKDAERYRWLRSAENDVAITFGIHAWEDLSDDHMDAAIDAAMGKDAGGHSAENQAETRENTGREAGGQGEVR